MPDKLGRLMFEFSGLIRRYRNREIAGNDLLVGLTDRDLAILEFVNQKTQATFGEIAQELRIADMPRSSASTISQAISSLYVDRELVEKRHNPKDQRQPIITLTAKGTATVESVLEIRRKTLAQVKTVMELSEKEANIFEDAFTRGIKNLDVLLVLPPKV